MDHETKVRSRLRSIEAAYRDLNVANRSDCGEPEAFSSEHAQTARNRASLLLLGIYHLRDDARGLARVLGKPRQTVDDFCNRTPAITTCIKAGDTFKHGTGGRAQNNTVIEHIAAVSHCPDTGSTKRTVLVMPLVTDEDGKLHQTDSLARQAMREWTRFLMNDLGIDTSENQPAWAEPSGSGVWEAELPGPLLDHVKSRSDVRRAFF